MSQTNTLKMGHGPPFSDEGTAPLGCRARGMHATHRHCFRWRGRRAPTRWHGGSIHADARSLYLNPGHPYTAALLESLPRLDQKGETLNTIKGLPPSLLNIPSGCPFHPRCRRAQDVCRSEVPKDVRLGLGRTSACHFAEEVVAGG